ncbi:MAG TPA: hypothetical protein VJV78_11060 [Polyangiales bacterium]|nr:hypothetical protein [Polyangiales bacterium]
MASAQEVDAEREDYVVSVVEFAGDTPKALVALQRLFSLNEADAQKILREAPVAVRRGVNRIRAEYFRRALELAGARVEVRDGQGELVQAQAPADPRSAPRAATPPQQPSPPRPAPQAAAAAFKVAPPTAAAPALRESARATPFGDTLVMGGLAPTERPAPGAAANDNRAAQAGGWGELQRPSAARAPAVAQTITQGQSQLEADLARALDQPPWAAADPNGPRELEADPALSLNRQAQAVGSALVSPQGPRELEAGDEPSNLRLEHGAPSAGARPAPQSPREISAGDPASSPVELAVDLRRRESSPRYDPIPVGELWKAPSAEAVARAQRKHQVAALESGMGDLRPSPRPPGMRRISEATARRVATPRKIASGAELGFWEVVSLPLSGSGFSRIILIALGCGGLGLIAKLAERLSWFCAPLLLVGLTPLLAMCVEYQRSAFWSTATGDDELEASPAEGVASLMRSGLYPLGLAAVTHVLLWVWLANQIAAGDRTPISIVASPALWVLGFGPGFYWPIALACAAARNNIRGVWDLGQGLRALGRAPLPLAQASLASGVTFALSLVVSAVVLSALSLGPAFTVFAAAGPAMALSHGLMGAWFGRVLRSQPELFE